ncbi:MAG: hypothetical protein M3R37_06380 [Actinomycetota bacterium]|nr:hypothetical protein [Actinomycetota bacterium]
MRFAAIVLAVVPLVLAAATPGARSMTPKPKTIASYCSTSGDVCSGIFNRSGKISLEITTAARYFTRYTLCVRRLPPRSTPDYAQRCRSFPVRRQGGSTWGSRVNYARQYPLTFAGTYRVTWKLAGSALGPALRFRLPVS